MDENLSNTINNYKGIDVHIPLLDILNAFNEARIAHSDEDWPWKSFNFVDQVSVMMEEAGEAVKAANDFMQKDDYRMNDLYRELSQTAAMCLRCMLQINQFEEMVNNGK